MTQAEATSEEHPLVGQTIASKYKIVRLLGEGGMGCVYLGEQMLGTTARKVAVKTLHKHLSHDESIKARFQREVGTVAALEHPNTIQVFDFGAMDDGTLYIVMEYVQGRSVADILEKDGAMPPARVENILRQVVGSLEEAHGHGIVHRDLKPDNVVLCERAGQKDWVEVLDFGIAKRSTEHDPNEAKLTQQGMVLGTPPYMSPEQFTGLPIDVRSDIYALGVMAYEMLTGRLPWEANTAWEWASKHMTEVPTPLERQPLGANVPPRMKAAIERALAKSKDDRFSTVREFFDAFSGGGAPASNPSPHASGTAVIGPPSGMTGPDSAASVGRGKTEMGTPAYGGGPPAGAVTPAPMPAPMAASAPAVIPPPMITAGGREEKKGIPPIAIGLGILAILLFVGAGIAVAMRGGKKTTTTAGIDLNGTTTTTTASSSVAGADTPPPEGTPAAPLDTSGMKIPTTPGPAPNNGGAKPVPTPTPSGKTGPVPTPQPAPAPAPPPRVDPPACVNARQAKARNQPPKTVATLEAQCRAAGGTP